MARNPVQFQKGISLNEFLSELLSNLVYGGLVMRPLYCPR